MRKMILIAALALLPPGDARTQGINSPEALAAAKDLAAIVSADTINQLSEAMTAQIWPKLRAEFGPKVDA
jgi:hypothetical protein